MCGVLCRICVLHMYLLTCVIHVSNIYYILWPDCMWYTSMWSLKVDQSGHWTSISLTSQWALIMTSQWVMMLLGMHIVKSKCVMTLLGTSIDITMSNNVAMCIYYGITMHNDVPMNLFYCVFSVLCLIMILLWVCM